jgi:hypothetical protein
MRLVGFVLICGFLYVLARAEALATRLRAVEAELAKWRVN